ncbi:MAG TPA: formylglycine-generating enzyme family protein [Candidatus Hydrogenedentes bacterium]|nr:formylglycine-generating enzyme family protein [Candidatus Hydrogenedentota bacterium]
MYAKCAGRRNRGGVVLLLMAAVFFGASMSQGEASYDLKGSEFFEGHPADADMNWRLAINEAMSYLAGWQQGDNPIGYAIRVAYLWQNGEGYVYDPSQAPPMCWMLPFPDEGEGEIEGEIIEGEEEGEGEGEGEIPVEGEPLVVPGELVDVPACTFEMGDPWNEGDSDEVPVHDVYLDAYRIGKYGVTNQEYADVLNWAKGQGYLTNSSGGAYTYGLIYAYGQPIADTAASSIDAQITYGWGEFGVCSRTGHGGVVYSMANHPMICVSWYGAVCYCNWLSEKHGLQPFYNTATWTRYWPVRNGYRLPTEAEWERAAAWAASGEGRHWRYGMTSDVIDFTRANYYKSGWANPLGLPDSPFTSPVGWYNGVNPARVSAPDTLTVNATSPVGVYDMSGNVWEWCHDWYDDTYYQGGAMTNPTGPSTGTYRVLRGGSEGDGSRALRSAERGGVTPDLRELNFGFRVVVFPVSR